MMSEMKQGTYMYGEDSHIFEFYTDLSTSKKVKFVNSIVSLVVDGENYNSVIRDLLFDFYIIDTMTNVDTTELKKSSNFLDDVEDFLLETNIVDIVKANAFPTLFEELNKAVDKAIEYRTGIHPNSLNEALSNLLSTLERKLDSLDMSKAMEMASKFSGMTDELTPENLVKAYLQTDIHKENLDEIAKTKKTKRKSTKKKDNVVDVIEEK